MPILRLGPIRIIKIMEISHHHIPINPIPFIQGILLPNHTTLHIMTTIKCITRTLQWVGNLLTLLLLLNQCLHPIQGHIWEDLNRHKEVILQWIACIQWECLPTTLIPIILLECSIHLTTIILTIIDLTLICTCLAQVLPHLLPKLRL